MLQIEWYGLQTLQIVYYCLAIVAMHIDLAHYAYDYDIMLSAHAHNKLVLLVLSPDSTLIHVCPSIMMQLQGVRDMYSIEL